MFLINPRRKRKHAKRRKNAHRRRSHVMKASGIFRRKRRRNARKRIVVVRKYYSKNQRRRGRIRVRGRRRNPALAVPSRGTLFTYVKNGFAIAGGYVSPRFVEPFIPDLGPSGTAMMLRKALSLVIPGIGMQFAARYAGISRKNVNLFWAGIGLNAAVYMLGLAGYAVPGLSAGDEVAIAPPPALVPSGLGVGGTFADMPERFQNTYGLT